MGEDLILTLKWLYYFLEICKDMNMSKTASRLFISQQGLSKAINSLENELQCTLFIRSHSGVTLTDAGTYLLQQGHQILDLIDTTQNHLKQYSESQDIQISVPNGASAIFTNRLPNQFAGRPISYTEVDEDEWISGLEKGSYDAAIVSDLVNSGKWYIRPFYKEYLALIVSAQQPITKSNPPDLTLLKGQTIIINERLFNTYDKFLKRMAKRGLTFSKVIRTFSPFTAMHQCAQDIGVCFLGEHALSLLHFPNTKVLYPHDPEMSLEFFFAARSNNIKGLVSDQLYQHLYDCVNKEE